MSVMIGNRQRLLTWWLGSSFMLAGCGGTATSGLGSSSNSQSPPAAANQSLGGIWTSQYSSNGTTVSTVALVTETGEYFSISKNQSNGCAGLATGQLSANGNVVSGSVIFATAAFSFGSAVTTACVYPDGSASGIGTVSGTIAARSSLILTASGNTSQGSVLPSVTYNSTFDQRYDTGSSIAAISGNWTGPAGVIMSIDGGGVIFAQDPASGCVVNGTISVIDSHYDVYSVRIKYGDCQGANAVLNGASASGLASLDQSGIPSVLDLAYTVTLSGGQKIIVAAEATR